MNKLKTNWAIRTTDEQFKAYIGTLESLGYGIYEPVNFYKTSTKELVFVYDGKGMGDGVVILMSGNGEQVFPNISSFLIYHFSSEKTEAEKELEALQEKMNSLQEQIDRVKLSVSK